MPSKETKTLLNLLLFMHVKELRDVCIDLHLSDKGDKKALIHRICHFALTEEKLSPKKFPEESKAKRNISYPLNKDTLILKGAYKNDLKTRTFFKQLLGSHFHFTAFGIDWLNKRWMDKNPPTYNEFAEMWKKQYAANQKAPPKAKKEWAFINFTKETLLKNPSATKTELNQAWKQKRQIEKAKALTILSPLFKKL